MAPPLGVAERPRSGFAGCQQTFSLSTTRADATRTGKLRTFHKDFSVSFKKFLDQRVLSANLHLDICHELAYINAGLRTDNRAFKAALARYDEQVPLEVKAVCLVGEESRQSGNASAPYIKVRAAHRVRTSNLFGVSCSGSTQRIAPGALSPGCTAFWFSSSTGLTCVRTRVRTRHERNPESSSYIPWIVRPRGAVRRLSTPSVPPPPPALPLLRPNPTAGFLRRAAPSSISRVRIPPPR